MASRQPAIGSGIRAAAASGTRSASGALRTACRNIRSCARSSIRQRWCLGLHPPPAANHPWSSPGAAAGPATLRCPGADLCALHPRTLGNMGLAHKHVAPDVSASPGVAPPGSPRSAIGHSAALRIRYFPQHHTSFNPLHSADYRPSLAACLSRDPLYSFTRHPDPFSQHFLHHLRDCGFDPSAR